MTSQTIERGGRRRQRLLHCAIGKKCWNLAVLGPVRRWCRVSSIDRKAWMLSKHG
ncbi:MAG TPA: hypothetical protein VND66_00485 [Acidobacteriaceae bacterium]|nr:hypothetical protein [Acidobacteriaceae bacterium]